MSQSWEKYLPKAEMLINSGYPVGTDDPVILAKKMVEKEKDINSSVSREVAASTYPRQPKED